MTESLFQKIKMFNRDIEKLVEGEEVVKEKETRLYNKLRDEFKAWVNVLTANTQKGKSRDSVPKAESRTPNIAPSVRGNEKIKLPSFLKTSGKADLSLAARHVSLDSKCAPPESPDRDGRLRTISHRAQEWGEGGRLNPSSQSKITKRAEKPPS